MRLFVLTVLALTSLIVAIPSVATTPALSKTEQFRKDFREAKTEEEKLLRLNTYVNSSIRYVEDKPHYGMVEKWVMLPKDSKGDCEDFALTKMEWLRRLHWGYGFMRVAVIDTDKDGDANHAVLEVRLRDGRIVVLDNHVDVLLSKDLLINKVGWRFLWDW